MDRQQILQTVQEIVQDVLGLNNLILTCKTTSSDVERWDSVSNIGIIMAIEQEFNFRFDLGVLESINNVGDIVDTIETNISAG